jgi:hypothetical protein
MPQGTEKSCDSSAGVATRLHAGLRNHSSIPCKEQEILIFCMASRLALGPIQPTVWVLGPIAPGHATDHTSNLVLSAKELHIHSPIYYHGTVLNYAQDKLYFCFTVGTEKCMCIKFFKKTGNKATKTYQRTKITVGNAIVS